MLEGLVVRGQERRKVLAAAETEIGLEARVGHRSTVVQSVLEGLNPTRRRLGTEST